MKKIIAMILAAIAVLSLAACGGENTEKIDSAKVSAKVFTLKGPTGMGMAYLMEDDEKGTSALDYDFTLASSPDEITAEIIKGNFDIAAVPANLAAVLYSKVPDTVRIAGVNTLGVLYILENGDTVKDIKDLNGKTIYATGAGSTPEFVLDYILKANDVDCKVEYIAEHSELAAKMISGDVSIGMLPVPNATTVLMKSDARVALDINELWDEAVNGSSALYQGCVIINSDFAEKNPKAVEKFMEEYKESVKKVNDNPEEASAVIEKFEILPQAAIALKAIPDANIVFQTGEDTFKKLDGFFKILYESAPSSVGGSLPDEGIYLKLD